MLNGTLKVGDYIFTANGKLARITKVNKQTYTISVIGGSASPYGYSDNVSFSGIKVNYYSGDHVEWFYCDNPQAKALELAMKRYQAGQKLQEIKTEIEKLLGKAKGFLEKITEIEVVEVEEEDK